MIVVAMEIQWSMYLLAVVFFAYPVHSHKNLQGLSCVNNYINTISCVWNSSKVDPGVDCMIIGAKKEWIAPDLPPRPLLRNCTLKQLSSPGNSLRGCSFVFEDRNFNKYEVIPSIQVECDGVLQDNLTNYKPCDHIKMSPPSAPSVSNSSGNETWISWSARSPQPEYVKHFEFQLQIKRQHQHWKEARTLSLQDLRLSVQSLLEPGQHQVRVRVRPPEGYCTAAWSDWSPSASWVTKSLEPPDSVFLTSWLAMGGMSVFMLFAVILFTVFAVWTGSRLVKRKPVPDPSKYFHSLNSVHRGNLKTWMSSPSGLESFFTAWPCDHISPVEVSDVWDVVPSASPSSVSTAALLHPHPDGLGSRGDQTSSTSSSSSCFSNLGYFYSSDPSSLLRSDPTPVYFTYQEDHSLHLTSSPSYECLQQPGGRHQKEPHSPDSGFGIGSDDYANEERYRVEEGKEEVSGGRRDAPLLILSLNHPPPSHEPPVAVPGGSYVAWPVGGAMGRPSSMIVAPCGGEYLTLRELQATCSNKSI